MFTWQRVCLIYITICPVESESLNKKLNSYLYRNAVRENVVLRNTYNVNELLTRYTDTEVTLSSRIR